MDSSENDLDFNQFKNELSSLPSFYSISIGHLDYKLEKNKNVFSMLNFEEIGELKLILEELNQAIQINIDENLNDDCEELASILRKSLGKHQKSVVTHKMHKKSIFKPLKKPKKIFVKVLKTDSPFLDTQNTQNIDSKKTTASSTTIKSGNNIINITEKVI